MNKKGALELSVNAIVILIIAVVVLGLILAFVRGLFVNMTDTWTQLLSAEQDPQTPDSSNIITLSRESIVTSPGKDQALKISVYNPTTDDWPTKTCQGTVPTTTTSKCNNKNANQCPLVADAICEYDTSCQAVSCIDIESEGDCLLQGCQYTTTESGVSPSISCSNLGDLVAQVNEKKIPKGSSETFGIVLSIPQSATGTNLCKIEVQDYSKDFTIKIK